MKKEEEFKKNPLLVPLLVAAIGFLMYMMAFHAERDENKSLKIEIIELKSKIKND